MVKGDYLMKHTLSGFQYEQLAKKQFYQLLQQVPFVTDVKISTVPASGIGDFNATVHFSDSNKTITFCIEVSAIGEKRFANHFIAMAGIQKDDRCYVFAAPYISDSSAAALRENQLSYMDLSGNCCIFAHRIYLYVLGKPNKYIAHRTMKNYFSKSSSAASAVMRTILNSPDKTWQVKELSVAAGKSIGMVSNVKSFLLEHAWIEESSRGFYLCNIKEMLYSWAEDYKKKSSQDYEYYTLDTIPQTEYRISRWNRKRKSPAVLAGFSAAARYSPTVRYKKVQVYTELQNFEKFVSDLDLKPVNVGGNVIITIPHDETPCMFSREINGDTVTSPVQTVIDLLTSDSRGEEAAEAIIQKEYKRGKNDQR
jgi:hypothetical protein